MACPFCMLPRERIVEEGPHTMTIRDAYPVSPGHTLVIHKRHVRSLFDATDEERLALWAAIARARAQLDAELHPDGWNLGVNDGEAAGQTVMHLHVHLIPRFRGDIDDPRSGVRHCVAGKGYYQDAEGSAAGERAGAQGTRPPVSPPSAEAQIQFLIRLQRLLDEGLFTASYKFALLLALAQVAVEDGDDSGAPLLIGTRRLAGAFVRLYWQQVVPYVALGRREAGRVLQQNTGKQAAVLRRLERMHERHRGSLASLMRSRREWDVLLGNVARSIVINPLWRLQKVGRSELRFLYERGRSGHEIVLLPGAAFCLRRFQPLIQDLVQGAWTRFVRGLPANHDLVGETRELGEFLFGSERASLGAFQPILRAAQDGRCFYCERTLGREGDVDHFVPWSRYAADLGHNFVLAHARCNVSKRDVLAAVPHLEHWCERNVERGSDLADAFDAKGLLHDLDASRQITRRTYGQAEEAGAQVWAAKGVLVELDARWRG